jgi:predicted metal-binding membrane protein
MRPRTSIGGDKATHDVGKTFIPTGIFAAGSLVAWGGFSALATGLQWVRSLRGVEIFVAAGRALSFAAAAHVVNLTPSTVSRVSGIWGES